MNISDHSSTQYTDIETTKYTYVFKIQDHNHLGIFFLIYKMFYTLQNHLDLQEKPLWISEYWKFHTTSRIYTFSTIFKRPSEVATSCLFCYWPNKTVGLSKSNAPICDCLSLIELSFPLQVLKPHAQCLPCMKSLLLQCFQLHSLNF